MSGLRKLELIYPTPSLIFEETTSIFSPFHIEQTLDFTLDLLNPNPTPFDLFLGSPFAIPTQLALPRVNSVSRTESYLNSLSDRIAALEDTLLAPKPKAKAKVDRKYTWTAQISSDEKDGLDRKYKLTTEIKGGKKKEEEKKYKWTAEIKGKGENSKLNRKYTFEASVDNAAAGEDDDDDSKKKKKKEKNDVVSKKTKKPVAATPRVVEIEDSTDHGAIVLRHRVLARIAAKAAAQQNPTVQQNPVADTTPRSEGTSRGNPKKRTPQDNTIEILDQQSHKRIQLDQQLGPAFSSQQTTPLRPILGQSDKDKEVIVRIEAGAQWTAGLAHPLQALSVFDLPADAANFDNQQPIELINRARRRFGRFAAEFVHLSNMYEKLEKEENHQKLLSETLSLRNERRQLSARVEDLQKSNKSLEAAKKSWVTEKAELVNAQNDLTQKNNTLSTSLEELKNENAKLKQSILGKDQELEQVKKELTAAELEAERALKEGYVICYEKIQAAGVDVTGMSYSDYVSELAEQLAQTTLHKADTSTAQTGGGEEQQSNIEQQVVCEEGVKDKKVGNAP